MVDVLSPFQTQMDVKLKVLGRIDHPKSVPMDVVGIFYILLFVHGM